jgi:hypothetical protein
MRIAEASNALATQHSRDFGAGDNFDWTPPVLICCTNLGLGNTVLGCIEFLGDGASSKNTFSAMSGFSKKIWISGECHESASYSDC